MLDDFINTLTHTSDFDSSNEKIASINCSSALAQVRCGRRSKGNLFNDFHPETLKRKKEEKKTISDERKKNSERVENFYNFFIQHGNEEQRIKTQNDTML